MTNAAGSDPLVRDVDDVLITAELASRASQPPNYEAESRALGLLAGEMASNPRGVLQKCAELAMELCHADSAGISILESGRQSEVLRWHAAAGGFAPNLHGTMPREASPCGTVMERDCVLLFHEAERFFPALRGVEPRIYENLLAPWHVEGKAVGTLWAIKHTPEGRFDAEDARVLQSLARFAAAAFQMTMALDEAVAERSALREREGRQRFLLQLSDALRSLADASEIQGTTARLLGEFLGADRSMYGEVEGERGAEVGTIRGQYVRPAAEGEAATVPFPEHFTFKQFGAHAMATRYRGETLVVRDVEADPSFDAAERAAWVAAGVRAAIVATLVKGGRLVAEFGVHSAAPRAWSETEVELVREVADRTWEAAERARSAEALTESEGRFRRFADASSDVLWIRNADTLAANYVSAAASSVYGASPVKLIGDQPFWDSLVVPDDRSAMTAQLEAARRGEATVMEFRVLRPSDQSFRWVRRTAFPLLGPRGEVQAVAGISSDITDARLLAEHQGVLLAELQHRVRNIMAMIRSMARRTADRAADVDDYRALLEGRLLALARVQVLLTRAANAGGSLREIIESEVSVQAAHRGQFELAGPDILLSPKAVEVLTLAFHELATNAIKYGAFSAPNGKLRVAWSTFEKRDHTWLALDWIETGAPSLGPVTRRGFGSDLIEGRIPYELGGTGKVVIGPTGAHCRLEFPLKASESILETDAPIPAIVFGGTLDMTDAPDLTGCRVLVVEDDYYMAGDTAAALRGAGAAVLGPCPTADATRDLLEQETPTHAVLDLNLGGGGPRFEIAHLLKARGVPFVFLTGYDPDVILPDLEEVVRLQKPVQFRSIVEAVSDL